MTREEVLEERPQGSNREPEVGTLALAAPANARAAMESDVPVAVMQRARSLLSGINGAVASRQTLLSGIHGVVRPTTKVVEKCGERIFGLPS